MKTGFLIGSGVSIPCGCPTTGDLTSRVYEKGNMKRLSLESYIRRDPREQKCERAESVVDAIVLLKNMIQSQAAQTDRFVNYEDLYYFSDQIKSHISGEYSNPLLERFIRDYETECLAKGLVQESGNLTCLLDLSREICLYIKCVAVHSLLGHEATHHETYNTIFDCLSAEATSCVFTLNHDTLIEHQLRQRGLHFCDGFSQPCNEVEYFDRSYFQQTASPKLVKLHGSVDWHRVQLASRYSDAYVRYNGRDFSRAVDTTGTEFRVVEYVPEILCGTFNKILDYSQGLFMNLFRVFDQELMTTKRLAVSGYSFGDKGVNSRVIEWMNSDPAHRIVIIHRDPNSLTRRSRGAIMRSIDAWRSQDRLHFISKSFENCEWDEIQANF